MYKYDGPVASIGRAGNWSAEKSPDVWDTAGDYLPDDEARDQPSAWVNNFCGNGIYGVLSGHEDDVWKDVTTDSGTTTTAPCDSALEECRYKDQMTGLQWVSGLDVPYFYWDQAVAKCADLTWNGITGWRLPTQKELMEAYIHGIWTVNNPLWLSLDFQNAGVGAPYWSATTAVGFTTTVNEDGDEEYTYTQDQAFYVSLREGKVGSANKNSRSAKVACVK